MDLSVALSGLQQVTRYVNEEKRKAEKYQQLMVLEAAFGDSLPIPLGKKTYISFSATNITAYYSLRKKGFANKSLSEWLTCLNSVCKRDAASLFRKSNNIRSSLASQNTRGAATQICRVLWVGYERHAAICGENQCYSGTKKLTTRNFLTVMVGGPAICSHVRRVEIVSS